MTKRLLNTPAFFAIFELFSLVLLFKEFPISTSSNNLGRLFGIVPSTPATIGTIVTFMFHNFSLFVRSRYSTNFFIFFFFFIYGLLKNSIIHYLTGFHILWKLLLMLLIRFILLRDLKIYIFITFSCKVNPEHLLKLVL